MEVNYFTILCWFCHTSTCIHHRYTHVPHPKPSFLCPTRTIPLDRLSVPAPSIRYHAMNLDCRLVSHMILFMFQCHSHKSSQPLAFKMQGKLCFLIWELLHRYSQLKKIYQDYNKYIFLVCHVSIRINKNLLHLHLEQKVVINYSKQWPIS